MSRARSSTDGGTARRPAALAVVTGITWLLIGGVGRADTAAPTIHTNVRINNDSAEARWHGMPTVAIDPANARHVIVSERHQLSDGSTVCEAHTSYDAMESWVHTQIPVPASCARFNTGQRVGVAAGGQGRAYAVADGPSQAYVMPSSNGGLSFGDAVTADAESGNRARLAVRAAPSGPDTLFMTRRYSLPNAPATPLGGTAASMSISRDGGATFTPRVQVTDNDKSISSGPIPAVGPKNRVYLLFTAAPPSTPSVFGVGASPIVSKVYLARSSDDGATWEHPNLLVDDGIKTAPSGEQNNYWPALAVDQTSGTIYAVWSDERNGDGDVFLRRSEDGGTTWQPIQRLSTDKVGNGRFQYRDAVSVAPNGRVDVVYYDAINNCAAAPSCYDTNVFMRSSNDHGASWGPPQKLNLNSFDYKLKNQSFQGGDNQDVDSSVAAGNEVTHAVWLDTQLGTFDNPNRDIFGSRAQYAPFVRIIPAPKFNVIAVPAAAAAPGPPPPPGPASPTPLPPAAPIVPSQPPPLLSGQVPAQSMGPMLAPGPAPAVRPEVRVQEATAAGPSRRAIAGVAGGAIGGLALTGACIALAARPRRRACPAEARSGAAFSA